MASKAIGRVYTDDGCVYNIEIPIEIIAPAEPVAMVTNVIISTTEYVDILIATVPPEVEHVYLDSWQLPPGIDVVIEGGSIYIRGTYDENDTNSNTDQSSTAIAEVRYDWEIYGSSHNRYLPFGWSLDTAVCPALQLLYDPAEGISIPRPPALEELTAPITIPIVQASATIDYAYQTYYDHTIVGGYSIDVVDDTIVLRIDSHESEVWDTNIGTSGKIPITIGVGSCVHYVEVNWNTPPVECNENGITIVSNNVEFDIGEEVNLLVATTTSDIYWASGNWDISYPLPWGLSWEFDGHELRLVGTVDCTPGSNNFFDVVTVRTTDWCYYKFEFDSKVISECTPLNQLVYHVDLELGATYGADNPIVMLDPGHSYSDVYLLSGMHTMPSISESPYTELRLNSDKTGIAIGAYHSSPPYLQDGTIVGSVGDTGYFEVELAYDDCCRSTLEIHWTIVDSEGVIDSPPAIVWDM